MILGALVENKKTCNYFLVFFLCISTLSLFIVNRAHSLVADLGIGSTAGESSGRIVFMDLKTGVKVFPSHIVSKGENFVEMSNNRRVGVAWSKGSVSSAYGFYRFIDLETGALVKEHTKSNSGTSTDDVLRINEVKLTPDGESVVAVTSNRVVFMDLMTGNKKFPSHILFSGEKT